MRFLAVTTLRNEAPYIVEWVALDLLDRLWCAVP